ncbi:acyltransferase ChoActase/COT/CPT [Amylocystis lapponica]|nr:acyltransferase ChoActase/COT/CPT [Amylocystis lapponica]
MLSRLTVQRLAMQTFPRSSVHSSPASSSTSALIRDLPRLPVPDLHQTLQKYTKSLEPFLLEDEAAGGPSFQTSRDIHAKVVEDFERGVGKICQERLLALDKASPYNWLDDNFWLKKAYHEWRSPLLINSNWWLAFINDRTAGTTGWQVRRAASLVHGVLDWKARLEVLYPGTTRQGIWLHDTTAQIFNICRIPQLQCDTFSSPPPTSSPNARKVLVILHDWFYAVEVLDQNLTPISPDEIERRLNAVVADVGARLERSETAVPVGVLSADDRDRWAKNVQHLLSLSPTNASTFQTICESIFALSLDPYTHVLPSTPSSALPAPNTSQELTAHLHNVRSGHHARPAHNRWWDKPLTLIVEANARAGALGEHSPCDALVPSIATEYAVVHGVLPREDGVDLAEAGWERLEWTLDARIADECTAAALRAREVVADSDNGLLWFDAYGAEWMKAAAGFSPDAYIQMALQLAWYRSRGCFTATYETALTRLYKRGRTETIRVLTTESRAFVLAMDDPQVPAQRRLVLLRSAIEKHGALTRQAALGRGIDRHLLGLQQMLHSDEREHHPLLDDPLFIRSQTWKLSTSGLSEGHQFRGTGFGAQYHDGYGINYLAGPDIIKFGIESKYSCPETSTEDFKVLISQALLDMRTVCSGGLAHL